MFKAKKIVTAFILAAVVMMMSIGLSSSAAPSQYVHGVFSTTPLYILDGTTGTWLTATSGNAIASWTEVPLASGNRGFFNAIVNAGSDRYEFRLIHLTSTTVDQINGQYDIYKNYVKVAAAVPGTVYGLSQPIGNYFKFYNSTSTWHVSAYITNRLDY